MKARDGTPDVAERFGPLCEAAGLRIIEQRGVLPAAQPIDLLETFQAVLRALELAKSGLYVSAFGNLYIEMIADVP